MSFLVDLAPKFSEVTLFVLIVLTVSMGSVFAVGLYRNLDHFNRVLRLQWSLFLGVIVALCWGFLAYKSVEGTQTTNGIYTTVEAVQGSVDGYGYTRVVTVHNQNLTKSYAVLEVGSNVVTLYDFSGRKDLAVSTYEFDDSAVSFMKSGLWFSNYVPYSNEQDKKSKSGQLFPSDLPFDGWLKPDYSS